MRALLDGDRAASRAHASSLGFVERAPEESIDRVVDALTRLYVPYRQRAAQRFPSLWSGVSLTNVLGEELADVRRHLSIPKDLVFVNRTLAGIYMVLSRLGATAGWERIACEYVCGDPPSTPLGAAERGWMDQRGGGA